MRKESSQRGGIRGESGSSSLQYPCCFITELVSVTTFLSETTLVIPPADGGIVYNGGHDKRVLPLPFDPSRPKIVPRHGCRWNRGRFMVKKEKKGSRVHLYGFPYLCICLCAPVMNGRKSLSRRSVLWPANQKGQCEGQSRLFIRTS